MKSPLVSVIIPCYNHEHFIQDCIESIIIQDYENIELIVIDDGSQDNSVKKIEELRERCDARFKRFEFRHRPNKGLCATLNEALSWVKGEYTASLGSDDVWVKNKTSLQVSYLNDHHETVAVFGTMILIDENSQFLEDQSQPFKRHSFDDIFLHEFYIPTPTNLCRTMELKETGGYDETMIIEDWLMWLKLAETGKYLDCLETTTAYYRRHGDNLSSKSLLMHEGRVATIKQFKHQKQYTRAMKNAYYIALHEIQAPKSGFIIKALKDVPSFLFSMKFWKKLIASY